MPVPAPSADARAVVTGASQNIGEALAIELASRGHHLVQAWSFGQTGSAWAEGAPSKLARPKPAHTNTGAANPTIPAFMNVGFASCVLRRFMPTPWLGLSSSTGLVRLPHTICHIFARFLRNSCAGQVRPTTVREICLDMPV